MTVCDKIDLENRIFARACALGEAVHGVYGGLVSSADDGELQTLLYVYNVNFRGENFKEFCTPQEALEQWQAYKEQRTHLPGLTCIYSPKELNFELVLSGDL